MKFVTIFVLTILISGCSLFEPRIEYRDRIVYQTPIISVPEERTPPERPEYLDPRDIIRYWAECEAVISLQRSDIMNLINSIESKAE